MRHALFVSVALLASLVAGCTGDEPISEADAGSDASGGTQLLALDYTGCREHMAIVPTPMMMVEGLLPAGYEPVPFDPAGLFAQTLAISLDCKLGDVEARELMGAIAVSPPDEYVDDGAFAHAWLLGGWVSDKTAKQAYDSWGALMELGPIGMTERATPLARYGYSQAGDADFSVSFDTVVQGPEGVQAAGHARVFYDGGLANATGPRAIQVSWNESKTMQGESMLYMMGGLLPLTQPGIGVHNWGDDYWLRIESIDLSVGS